ncbi:hypothetical protein MTR_8g064340 [Medicago truncatula]|uniref:Uncharacterized protein n=1 Tax=Medicago truncatula TaxID=3880 RepID=A0A072TR57_MEDTR|nr:hypothetical protein MTR_8g064340 [Medicago truncatula]
MVFQHVEALDVSQSSEPDLILRLLREMLKMQEPLFLRKSQAKLFWLGVFLTRLLLSLHAQIKDLNFKRGLCYVWKILGFGENMFPFRPTGQCSGYSPDVKKPRHSSIPLQRLVLADDCFPECNILFSDDTISRPPTAAPS